MRNCFLPPIPEFDAAATLLDQSAHAVLAGDYESAKRFLREADLPEICAFTVRITGPIDPEIHWQKAMPIDAIPKAMRAGLRMPSSTVELSIFRRDGWRCRFCGSRVISRRARTIIATLFPAEARWGKSFHTQKHCALGSLAASLDHIVPHARGGSNEESNLVTACTPCQFGRNQWTLEEVGFTDPRSRAPVPDAWDGLTRLIGVKLLRPELDNRPLQGSASAHS